MILTGHSHLEFPGPAYKDVPGVNLAKGTINGKVVLMPGFWGNNLGVADLKLNFDRKTQKWTILDAQGGIRPIWDKAAKKSLVTADTTVAAAVEGAHQGTLGYVRGKVADLTAPSTPTGR